MYQPLRDYTLAQELVGMCLDLVASTDLRLSSLLLNASELHCDTRNLTISGLFAVTLSSLLQDFIILEGSMFL